MSNIAIKAENLSKAYQIGHRALVKLGAFNHKLMEHSNAYQKSVGLVRMRAAAFGAMTALGLADADCPFFASFLWANKEMKMPTAGIEAKNFILKTANV